MSFLIVALVFVTMLCMLNLALAVGLIKRLREHTELLSTMGDLPVIGVGEEVGDFLASTADDQPLDSESLNGETLVGFFSANCQPCKEKMPKFAEYARTLPGGRDRVLAVMTGDADELASSVAALSPVARVVVEDRDGPMNRAFKVAGYPTVLRVAPEPGGRLVVTANKLQLNQPAGVAA